jgi:MerR family mercuric resistance operon transcriptional regulator
MESLTIGKVARRAGVGVETIRFYERKGLIDEPPRRASGYRQYPEETVARLQFIKRAKELGFTLREIMELLKLQVASSSTATCDEVRKLAREKIADVRDKIRMLRGMEAALARLIGSCQRRVVTSNCPILEALDQKEVP